MKIHSATIVAITIAIALPICPQAHGDSLISASDVMTGAISKAALQELFDSGQALIHSLESAGNEVAKHLGDELRSALGDMKILLDKFDTIQGKFSDSMLKTVAKAMLLVQEGELAARSLVACTAQELHSLWNTIDASLTSITASSIPWNGHRGYISSAHDARHFGQRGLRVGHAGTFVFEGAFIGFDLNCGTTEAKIRQVPGGQSTPLKLDFADPRKVGIEIPSQPARGLYQVDIGYPASSGILGTCEQQRRVVSAFIPVEDGSIYDLAYKLRAKCDGEVRTSLSTDVYVDNNDCDNGSSKDGYINLSNHEACHFGNIGTPELYNGGGNPTISNEATRIVLHVRIGPAWCRKVLGTVVDRRGVSAGYRLHATQVCKTTGILGSEVTGSSGVLQRGASVSSHVAVDPSAPLSPGLQPAKDCVWLWQPSLVRRQGPSSEVVDFPPVEGRGDLQLIDRRGRVRATWNPTAATVTSEITEGLACEAFQ